MRKNKLLLLLALLMTAATGAWATDYTTLAVGDVIKVGDTFTPTADGGINDNGVSSGKTYTLIRADIDNDYNVTEKTDGAYYVFKFDTFTFPYIHFEKAFAVTAISDGLEVTNIVTEKGYLFYTLALHESAASAGYTVSLEEGTKDAENWTGKVGEGNYGSLPLENVAEGAAVKLKYNGLRKVKSVTATTEASTGPVLVQSIELNYTGKMTIVGSNWLQIKTFRVLPTNATDKSVTWSVDGTHIRIQGYSDDGSVRINGNTPGTGWVKATANDGSGVSVTLEVEFKLN